MKQGIYLIRHRATGRGYVGRSVDIEHRWSQHRAEARLDRASSMLYNALRKYGVDAFDFVVLELVDLADDLPIREAEHIAQIGTMKPAGFNLGGTAGGFPSRAQIAAMPDAERARWREVLSRVSRAGADALARLREDPAYEAAYRATKSEASRKREANIRVRRAADPEYDMKMRAVRSRAGGSPKPEGIQRKAAETFKNRMVADSEFASRVRENRRRAGAERWVARGEAR